MPESRINDLNPEQLRAATAGEGPVLTIAGAGTGKTKTLASRVAWLVSHGIDPGHLVRVRHYGWLSPAAHKAFLRVRFLLGLGPYRIPPLRKSEPPRCPFCNGVPAPIARIASQRGPPLSRAILKAAA
jgi:UvrD-like helicase family protein